LRLEGVGGDDEEQSNGAARRNHARLRRWTKNRLEAHHHLESDHVLAQPKTIS